MGRPKSSVGAKLIALMLIIGGVVGIVVFIRLILEMLAQRSLLGLFDMLGVVIFGGSAFAGFDLWRGKPAGYRWAKILFAAQIPIIIVSGFQYWFYTGLNAWLMIQGGTVNGVSIHTVGVGFYLGSSLSIWFGGPGTGYALGVNPIAIGILIFLSTLEPPNLEQASEVINPISPDIPPHPSPSLE